MVTRNTFCFCAQAMLHHPQGSNQCDPYTTTQFYSFFYSHFGTSPDTCLLLWQKCTFPPDMKPCHLLWALLFLKLYATEEVLSNIAGSTRKTFRKWAWIVIEAISKLGPKVVSCCVCFLTVQLQFFPNVWWYSYLFIKD